MNKIALPSVLLASLLAANCAAPADDNASVTRANLEAEDDGVVTSCNATGCWTAEAIHPIGRSTFNGSYRIHGGATFTGPEGAVRGMGVCLLKQYEPAVPCTTIADCTDAPTALPAGGFRYCTEARGETQKTCFYRPGRQADFCAGTPAMPGLPSIPPGTWMTPVSTQTEPATWISYACFEGCRVVPAAISKGKTVGEGPAEASGN